MDPDILAILGPIGQGPPVGDIETRRKNLAEGFAAQEASADTVPGVERTDVVTAAADGTELKLSWYRNTTAEPRGSAVLYLHGGGFIVPLLPAYDGMMRAYTKATGVAMLVVDYRVAPEHPPPHPRRRLLRRTALARRQRRRTRRRPHPHSGDG